MLVLSLFTVFSLFVCSIISGYTYGLRKLGRLYAEKELSKHHFLFFQSVVASFFKKNKWDNFFFSLSLCKHLLRICYALGALSFSLSYFPFPSWMGPLQHLSPSLIGWLIMALAIICTSFFIDCVMILIALMYPHGYLRIFSPVISCLLILCTPISALFFKIFSFFTKNKQNPLLSSLQIKNKILEVLYESELASELDFHEQKLILSMALFKERIAKEVMIPRIDILCLPADTTIQTAIEKFVSEGYSRIPVYQDSLDHIIGVVLYKDLLALFKAGYSYEELQRNLQKPIETVIKPVIYTPETKKISHLLQEFRSKQIHLAIVVDEYGGTAGIVTIEDILEELVGEIADEHDIAEAPLFTSLPSGDWIVDAKMSIIDIEKQLDIFIPKHPDYDTIGGYIFHCAGLIPKKGWKLHHDDFDLEVLSSDDRSIKKIRISRNLPSKETS